MLVSTWALLGLLAIPTGQSTSGLLFGDGFIWPRGALVESLLGLLGGVPGRGLTPVQASTLPSRPAVYLTIAVVEVVLGAVAVWGLAYWWRSIGPGAQFGLASRHDVERVLGRADLCRRGLTIRPDLATRRGGSISKGFGR